MSENMSIDDIIKQAEEIRKKAVKKTQNSVENTQASVNPTDDTKAVETPVSSKTAIVDNRKLKSAAGTTVSDKTRTVEVQQKTAVVPTVSSGKKSFFNVESDEPLYSKTPPEIIEKPATIKSKSRFDKTSDLEEIPTIVAVDELEHTKISIGGSSFAKPETPKYTEDEGEQIVLDGFDDDAGKISKIDESVAEEQLRKRREEKVNKFRLFSPDDISEGKTHTVKNEFNKIDDKTAFMEKLFASESSFTLRAIFTFVPTVLLLLLSTLKDTAYLPSFLLDYSAYYIAELVLYIIVLLINIKNIVYGFKLKGGINYSFPVSIVSIVVLIHSILLIYDTDFYIESGMAMPLVTAFAFFITNVGKRALIRRIITNFEFLTKSEDIYTVETIVNTVDATIISRGLLTGEANLKTSIKTDFPTNYLDISCSDEPADSIAKITGSVMLALSTLLFVIISIVNQNWYYGFNVGVCAMCISLPVISIFSTNRALSGVASLLSKKGAMINGFEGASMMNDANAIVLEAQDLFGRNSCEIHGIKTFGGAKTDDVILQTAAVIMKTKSPLSYVFDDVIIGKQTILPDVDGVVYEDRLGTSAWIYRKKVLVGTRELLIHHGVAVPKEEFEQRQTRKGRKILYLAVAGKLMGMFVVSYNAEPEMKRSLKKLEKSGITMLVKSADPFINDESIAELFSLPEGFVRVMNSSNARTFEKYSNMCVEKSPAYVVHDGSALGFVYAMAECEYLVETKKLLSILITFGSAMGFAMTAMLGFIGGLSRITPLNIIIFQLLWCIFVDIVSRIKRTGL